MRGGGSGSVSVAGLACYRPAHRTRLIYRMHHYRGRKGETKAFTWTEYRDLLTAAHHQLPGGRIVLIWDNLSVHLRAELRAFTTAQPWLQVVQLPSYAPASTRWKASGPASSAARWPTSPSPASPTCCRSSRPA